jgi:hypothetical protein
MKKEKIKKEFTQQERKVIRDFCEALITLVAMNTWEI